VNRNLQHGNTLFPEVGKQEKKEEIRDVVWDIMFIVGERKNKNFGPESFQATPSDPSDKGRLKAW
jgi:hypothetical protein